MTLFHGDCLKEMNNIEKESVDLVLVDPPYGKTSCKWDSIIPLGPMWQSIRKILKPNGTVVMTASQPFTSVLICSNLKMFKYSLVWEKSRGSNFVHAKYQPLKTHEDICVWSYGGSAQGSKSPMTYNPQMSNGKPYDKGIGHQDNKHLSGGFSKRKSISKVNKTGLRMPRSVQYFNSDSDKAFRGLHPTQKPVALMEFLIKTYSNENDTVLDFAMGSGSTGIAAHSLNRNFIGIESEARYFKIAEARMNGDEDLVQSLKKSK